MICDRIGQYLTEKGKTIDEALRYEVEKIAGFCFKRQFMTDEESDTKGKLRMSSCGKCPRQLAYAFHGFEKKGKEIDARAKLIFFAGDICELVITNLAKLAGCTLTATGLNQLTLTGNIMRKVTAGNELPVEVTGHPDGMVLHEGKWYLLEVKSMSSYAFERFQECGDVDDSYICQMNIYMHKLDLDACVLVGYNKDSGVMHEIIVKKDSEIVRKAVANLQTVVDSTPESLPPQPAEFGPDEKGYYTWNCLYCAYWGHCRTNAERVLVRNSYKLKEKS